jgi:hypothetical protein
MGKTLAYTFSPTELFGTLEMYQCKEETTAYSYMSLCMNFSLRSSSMDLCVCACVCVRVRVCNVEDSHRVDV